MLTIKEWSLTDALKDLESHETNSRYLYDFNEKEAFLVFDYPLKEPLVIIITEYNIAQVVEKDGKYEWGTRY